MSEIFCGIGKIPKGARRGSMKECIEKGQVRLYGLKKIDPRLIEGTKQEKKKSKKAEQNKTQIFAEISKFKVRIKKLNEKLKIEKSDTKKSKIKKDLDAAKKSKKDLTERYKQIK
jgi:hypothetical protein